MGGDESLQYKSFAKGGEFTTDGPEMILVGDNPGGKEKVTVKPIKSKKKEPKQLLFQRNKLESMTNR